MDIKWYVLGSLPPVGPIFGVLTTSLKPRVPPPLAPSSLPLNATDGFCILIIKIFFKTEEDGKIRLYFYAFLKGVFFDILKWRFLNNSLFIFST